MRLRKLQELTNSDLYTPDSPRMQRQIWAVQVGGKFDNDPNPYTVPYGYGIVGVDAINGDIHLRARYDEEGPSRPLATSPPSRSVRGRDAKRAGDARPPFVIRRKPESRGAGRRGTIPSPSMGESHGDRGQGAGKS